MPEKVKTAEQSSVNYLEQQPLLVLRIEPPIYMPSIWFLPVILLPKTFIEYLELRQNPPMPLRLGERYFP